MKTRKPKSYWLGALLVLYFAHGQLAPETTRA
jgi:hypothetical protein